MTQKELEHIALQKNILKSTIDKDWVLGHLLNAIFSSDDIKNNFVFKGGTCLKKCYFQNYRFSEDLDFTLLTKKFPINSSLFRRIIRKAENTSGINYYLSEIKEQIHNNIQQGYEIKIKFWGADHKPNAPIPSPNRWQTFIKLDISFTEQVFDVPKHCEILHPYTDFHLINEIIPSYSLTEIMAEKLRALIQRNRPRDVYDIWYIMNSMERPDKKAIKKMLQLKAKSKEIDIFSLNQFVNNLKMKKNKRAWKNSLSLHLPLDSLPDFDMVYTDLYPIINSILKA
jgi:predicted nucleotidyltransferase component of viral defense system